MTESYIRHVSGTRIKVAIVGPESSGKTTLCEALGWHCREKWVGEHARHYLDQLGRPYAEHDLLAIAQGQIAAEDDAIQGIRRSLFCDTDMITIRIWSEEKYGRCHPELERLAGQRHYDHWLLCRPDIPWEADPLRENPHDRDRLFGVYEAMLKRLGKPYTIVEGDREERLAIALSAVDRIAVD